MLYHQINPQNYLKLGSRLIFPAQKNVQSLLETKLHHQNTRQCQLLTVTKNIKKNLSETVKLRRTDPTLQQLPLLENP